MANLHCVVVKCSVLQYTAVYCSIFQCAAVYCSVLQCVAVCCSVLQYNHRSMELANRLHMCLAGEVIPQDTHTHTQGNIVLNAVA